MPQQKASKASMEQESGQHKGTGLKNPITLMSYVTPVMALVTALLSLMFDPWINFKQNYYFNGSRHIVRSCLLMLLGGGLAFFMVLTEYILVSATSAVTVTIAGVVKEAVTIVVAVFYFHDEFTLLKGFGLLTIMVGVSLFNWYKAAVCDLLVFFVVISPFVFSTLPPRDPCRRCLGIRATAVSGSVHAVASGSTPPPRVPHHCFGVSATIASGTVQPSPWEPCHHRLGIRAVA
ncbi:putative sugar phosphate/phosphate translocator [Nymphaea thermarum]|nr:putative sugar phosphate/phosphate translocator [Nymphaea thermarum]